MVLQQKVSIIVHQKDASTIIMTIDTETLLPEASSSGDVSSEMVAVDLKGTGDILLSPSTTEAPVALPTSSADLFGGELGVDELNGKRFKTVAVLPY